jgi:toxin ParE1/3/4
MRPVRLRYTAQAREHIAGIYDYIRQRNPAAAIEVIARIRLAAERLTEFPRIGHAGRVAGTHEWVVRGLPCIIVYEIGVPEPDEVLVLGVFHGAQNRERE